MTKGEYVGNKNLAYYCDCFSKLKLYKGEALNKPVLLLSVIDLIAQGLIQNNQIPVSDELIETFNNYWNLIASGSSYKGGLHYPFIYLQTEGFWCVTFKLGYNGIQPKTTSKLKAVVENASLDRELFDLLQDPISRQELIDTLIAAWFSANQKKIEDILKINQDFQNSNPFGLSTTINEPRFILKKFLVRNAFFRKAIVHIYDYRCAFCRLKVTRSLNQNIVDGAHIKPFSEFYDSQTDNGIAFCKNHHWAFDQGWFSIDDDYKIIVASDLQEESPNARAMQDFQNESLLLPTSESYRPRIDALRWHRKNKFKA